MTAVGILAGAFFALALALLAVFFITKSTRADWASNLAFPAFEILMIPVMLEIHRRYVDQAAALDTTPGANERRSCGQSAIGLRGGADPGAAGGRGHRFEGRPRAAARLTWDRSGEGAT